MREAKDRIKKQLERPISSNRIRFSPTIPRWPSVGFTTRLNRLEPRASKF